MAVLRPLGSGPDRYAEHWPPVPLLILGPTGSGRRSWAEWLLDKHQARASNILAQPAGEKLSTELARRIPEFFSTKSKSPKWATVCFDDVSTSVQNILLKTLEELPPNCRVILRGRVTDVLGTVRSRCEQVTISPGTLEEEVDRLEYLGLEHDVAEELVQIRPGRPGVAVKLQAVYPAKQLAKSVLQGIEDRSELAVATTLAEFPPEGTFWLQEWLGQALSRRTADFPLLRSEAGVGRLYQAKQLLDTVPHHRLAVRAMAALLMDRPG